MQRTGTQSIERAFALLREISARPKSGWRLTDLAERAGLDRGTTRRILAALARERVVAQRADRHYVPGPALYELGLAQPAMRAFEALVRPSLARLVAETRCLAFLYLRSGADFVCAARVGSATIRGLSVEVGTRRPLCVSAGGIAILVALPKAEGRRLLAENLRRLRAAGDPRLDVVGPMMRRSWARGVGLNVGEFVPRITALGVAIRGPSGAPFSSITVSGPVEELPRANVEQTIAAIEAEVRGIEERGYALLQELEL